MNQLGSSTSSISLRPTLAHQRGAFSEKSNYSVSSIGSTTTNRQYRHSTQFPNRLIKGKSWVRIQVDSIFFDLKNDQYSIKLSNAHILSFDFASKSCSIKLPSNKVQIDTIIAEEDKSYDDSDFDKLLEEIDNQSSGLQIENIQSEWKQLQQMFSKYRAVPVPNGNNALTTHKGHKPSHSRIQSRIHNSCSLSIEHCPHIQRIVFILKLYVLYLNYKTQQLHNNQSIKKLPSSVTQIIDALEDYDHIHILNDYHHIKQQHINHNELHELKSYIQNKTPLCEDAKTCICCNRNKESKQIYKDLSNKTRRDLYLIHHDIKDCSNEEMNEINIQTYLDTIHSSLIHQSVSENMNYKYTTHVKPFDDNQSSDSADDDRKTRLDTYQIDESGTGSEYDLSVDDDVDDDGIQYDYLAHFYNIKDVEHTFGEKFSYWNATNTDYIAAKHTDLKTELLCKGMSNDDYKCLYLRAKDFLECESGKDMVCKRQFSWMQGSVNYADNISIDHIIAAMIQTNYVELRDNLINTGFKRMNEEETLQELTERHCEIANFCRLLKESIFCFGDSVGDRSRLYHGVDCKLLFNTTSFSFNVPISTTIKYSIAPISNNGICIKFGKPIFPNQKNYYLDVSDLSHFPDEKERVMFGGEALGFMDIIYNGHSHSEQIMSLRLFRHIVQGHWYTNIKQLMKTKYQRRIIKMINSLMNDGNLSQSNTNYITEMFKNLAITNLRENTIWINKEEIGLCLPELGELILNKFQHYLSKGYDTKLRCCDLLELNLSKKQIEISSFRKSIYSSLYTFKMNDSKKVSFVFRCFQKHDPSRNESMLRGFVAIKYLPKGHNITKIQMRYGLYFPQKDKLSKWEYCTLSPTNLYKGSSLFSLAEIKQFDELQIKVCFQIISIT